MTKGMNTNCALVIDAFDVLKQLYDQTTDREEKGFLRALGVGIVAAVRSAAVYSTAREVEYLAEYANDRWAKLRSELDNNSQTVFNHGDGKPEDSIILLAKAAYPEVTVDVAILLMRFERKFSCIGFRLGRGSNTVQGLPWLVFERDTLGAKARPWPLAPEVLSPDEARASLALYCGSLCYLDDQLKDDKDGAGYGDGMRYQSIFHDDFLRPPAWVRESVDAE